jgi:RimJ/RimL family protein N-acetyltransferase
MGATPLLQLDELILQPINRRLYEDFMAAHLEDPEGTFSALPGIDPNESINTQFADLLFELEVHSNLGNIHFWSIHFEGVFVGLVGLGDELQAEGSKWNLGYWVRSSARKTGIAVKGVNLVFSWLNNLDSKVQVEITVHPENIAGLNTCKSICNNWNGVRAKPDYWPVEIRGRTVLHTMWLVTLGGSSLE